MDSKVVTTCATIIGLLLGVLGTVITMNDRMEKKIIERVSTQVDVARLKERVKANESNIWNLQQQQHSHGNKESP